MFVVVHLTWIVSSCILPRVLQVWQSATQSRTYYFFTNYVVATCITKSQEVARSFGQVKGSR